MSSLIELYIKPKGCDNCRCRFCARSSALDLEFFTQGEVSDIDKVCYTCENCKWYDTRFNQSQQRGKCDGYMEAMKYTQYLKDRAEDLAAAKRKNFRVIKGGKST